MEDGHDLKDHISKLPNNVLVSILNHLTLKEAAATSILARSWLDLWKHKAQLNFDAHKVLTNLARDHSLLETERAKYIDWVNQVIMKVHQGLIIEEFRVCFDLEICNTQDIDRWLKFAFARKVERLELDLIQRQYYVEDAYALKTELCFPEFISLKRLSLKCVNVTGDTLEFFLANCPFLEDLEVHASPGLVNLEVSGLSLALRHLEIFNCRNLKSVEITKVNLVTFKFYGKVDVLSLHDLPSLVEFYISTLENANHFFARFSGILSTLEVLTLSLEMATELKEMPQVTKLKQLTLISGAMADLCLLEYANLVNVFPSLEKFSIQLWSMMETRSDRVLEYIPSHPHRSLKVVVLAGYYGHISDVELAMYFLKNATALEELVIDPRSQITNPYRMPKDAVVIKWEQAARIKAKHQLPRITPQNVKLKIL